MDDKGFHDTPFYCEGNMVVWHYCVGHDRDTLVLWIDRDNHFKKCTANALKLREQAERSRRAENAERLRKLNRLRKESHARA